MTMVSTSKEYAEAGWPTQTRQAAGEEGLSGSEKRARMRTAYKNEADFAIKAARRHYSTGRPVSGTEWVGVAILDTLRSIGPKK